jgi:hypothetical protein
MGVALVSRIRGESFFGDEKCASGGASGEAEEVPKKKIHFKRYLTISWIHCKIKRKKSPQILK